MGALTVTDVGKAYKRYPDKGSRLREWLLGGVHHEARWVLKNVSFSAGAGEAIGVLGVNGAGKSTLLKIITGVTEASAGSVSTNGRVAAILELGMGFHPDFSGRQNIQIAGQLLGYSAAEISAAEASIISFADLGEYIDQPVRTYSSGMGVRLAFAVATMHRPDILIVDEALSVGDAAFQRKCHQRIDGFREAGTTLLFVSHDIEAVKRLCDKALFLKDGTVCQFGPAATVCDAYEQALFGGSKDGARTPKAVFDPALNVTDCERFYGSGEATITRVALMNADGVPANTITAGEAFVWAFDVEFHRSVERPLFSMMLKTVDGTAVYGTRTSEDPAQSQPAPAGAALRVCFHLDNHLAPGNYYLNCGVRDLNAPESGHLCRRMDCAILRVTQASDSTALAGTSELNARSVIQPLGNVSS